MKNSNTKQFFCKRCGTCCKKGGPTLHIQDINTIYNIPLKPKHLLTLRKGELIWHPTKNQLIPLQYEIIKIRGKKTLWTCIFYNEILHSCNCYKNRPIECKLLKCWDTKDVEKLFLKETLDRKTLLKNAPHLLDLINNYEKKFDLNYFFYLVKDKKEKELKKIIDLDKKFRKKLSDTTQFNIEDMDFFFGRSLEILFKQLNNIFNQ